MPKEFTHWRIAWEAALSLPAESDLRAMIHSHQEIFLLGAVLPDTLLYFLTGPSRSIALDLAEKFHSPPGSSYLPLIEYLQTLSFEKLPPPLLASLAGIACHIESDITFHPFVYALAGKDMGIHYRIETKLDLWLLYYGKTPPVFFVSELLAADSLATSASVLAGVFDPESRLPRKAMAEALKNHSRYQRIFSSPKWILTARILGLVPGTPVKSWQWLFYPLGWQRGRKISWPEKWDNPAGGKEMEESPEELLKRAVARTKNLFENIDRIGVSEALRQQTGENLLTGLPPQ